ncbi:MAG: P27 family phage terminase small subunit [Bacteroidetes bacterium]|nr:P27 family phage terminase small subunit [Bacteroidota bacterium]
MKKTTNNEKLIKGTLQKCRVKENLSYDPLNEIPKPEFDLNADGKEYFESFCSILLSNRTLTDADIPIITRAARYYELYKEADKGIKVNGAVQITQSGYSAKTGHFVAMLDAEKRITEIEALYGMNLTARGKINIPKTEKKNAFDLIDEDFS